MDSRAIDDRLQGDMPHEVRYLSLYWLIPAVRGSKRPAYIT